MKQWKRVITVCAASIGLGLLSATPALSADPPAVAPAAKEVAKDLVLKGDAKCTRCHDEADGPQLLAIGKTRHGVRADSRTPTCTSCHGESDKHLAYKGSGKPPSPDRTFGKKTATSADERSGACMTCHSGDNKRAHWDGSPHASRDVACSSCHQVHVRDDKVLSKKTQADVCFTCHKEQRAQASRISHHPIKEGKVTCSDCHNPHGSTGPKQLVKNTLNETCFTCHAEKRGPFLWEHTPVSDDCSNCHTPHGSTISPLLTSRQPFLCQSCHNMGDNHAYTPDGGNYLPGGSLIAGINGTIPANRQSPRNQATGRACLNCHVMVHGSNHPAGAIFNR